MAPPTGIEMIKAKEDHLAVAKLAQEHTSKSLKNAEGRYDSARRIVDTTATKDLDTSQNEYGLDAARRFLKAANESLDLVSHCDSFFSTSKYPRQQYSTTELPKTSLPSELA
jgi:hypothetical protein